MKKLAHFFKYRVLPPSIYLPCSVKRKAARAARKGEPELNILTSLISKQGCCLDIGANKGLYTYLLSKAGREVHAFEPIPRLAHFLKKARLSGVNIYNVALSDKKGEASLYIPEGQRFNISSLNPAENSRKITVPTSRLDDYDFGDIAFIKIDVEGHEINVLNGARQTITDKKPVMLLEANEQQELATMTTLLAEHGYSGVTMVDYSIRDIEVDNFDSYGRNFIFMHNDDKDSILALAQEELSLCTAKPLAKAA